MKIINILFCLFLLILNSCTANDTHVQQPKNRGKRDLSQQETSQETPKSKEEILKEKLSDDQKTNLDWLKTALTNAGEFDKFLENDESKIKSALDHIKKELDKCTGQHANDQKNTFKALVKAAFESRGINDLLTATSTCNQPQP
ncbi:Mlp family lipoprotein [Borreliella americana]|uniref:Mlp family lipoprotein n=1 Tax=Borreliella americana TaxID=478807 RepID=UPI001E48A404|nr:Mlp family lipoprotein [Borreliella americana]MCD2332789.1 Mlp family lipoprotein [Borreliella americana]